MVDPDAVTPDDDSAVLSCRPVQDRQGWWVELLVAFTDEVVTRRIGPYPTEQRATVAAHHIERAAGRSSPPPTGF